MPGNYVILDYDGDGTITSFDQIPYGFSNVPENTVNFQFGLDYKGFSGFVQFYGASNVTRYVGLNSLVVLEIPRLRKVLTGPRTI
ncbi:hypothetical protein [Geofilum rubicundum]|uniref:TonB-dependent receptor n=1 Tax=Geofilum rubicundum JCM 15548 TaxID=1236989 RepID=A0A0E9LVF1_9BACT|nr:hypothetical protein [Geofilum rubicundum]GAO28850.1 hypothetical protein JCM15548_1985 [Geofilum rubicundum JCM 15548]